MSGLDLALGPFLHHWQFAADYDKYIWLIKSDKLEVDSESSSMTIIFA